MIRDKMRVFLFSGNQRTITAKRNIIISMGLKAISIIISLQVVALTIDYVNPVQYGIWLTLSSIIAWFTYFDCGFAHGFRNRFAEARANQNDELARCYVSTTYAALGLIFFLIFIVSNFLNYFFLDWALILNVNEELSKELQIVFVVLSFFFCCNIVLGVVNNLLMADQKTAFSAFLQTGGQVLSFIVIHVMIHYTEGSLVNLAIAFSGIPCLFLFFSSIFIYCSKKYKRFSPQIRSVRLSLAKKTIGLGGQFFVITISMLVIYQFLNVVLSRVLGPEVVTQYNIAYKYFNVLNMITTIILMPFWSAFTEAYVKRDFDWMQTTQRKLEKMWLLCIPIIITMILCSDFIFSWWIGDQIKISSSLSITIAIYILLQTLVGVYVTLINGISKVRIQLIIYLSFSIIALPAINWGCKEWGVEGALIIPISACICQIVFGRVQVLRLVNDRARGIWNK